MGYIFVGLGNPGEKYEHTRHNTGRSVLSAISERKRFPQFEEKKNLKALVCSGTVAGKKVLFLLPQTFMNKSGTALKTLITSQKKAETLVVLYDDLDLPLGSFKISFGRSSGGHNGLESVIRSVKTKNFIRIRIGISPAARGKIPVKKPHGEKNVLNFLLSSYSKRELDVLEGVIRDVEKAIEVLVVEGRARAMSTCN